MQLLYKWFLQLFKPVSAEPCVGGIQWFFSPQNRLPFGKAWGALGLNFTWTFFVSII